MTYFLRTLGTLTLVQERDGQPVASIAAHRNALAVLAVLAADGSASRDRLMAILWPESGTDRARNSLNQTIHYLRHSLGAPDLLLGRAELAVNPAAIRSDVGLFREALSAGDDAAAAALHRAPFLDGVHLNGSKELEDWADGRRAALERDHAAAIERLAERAEGAGARDEAVEWWRKLQAARPLDERVALRLMQALAAAGRRSAALQHAEAHQRILRDELDIPPDPAIAGLAERLRRGAPAPAGGNAPPADRGDDPRAAAPARGTPARWALPAAAVVVAVVALAAGDRRGPVGGAPYETNLVAVAPFDVADSTLALWREGLVDILSLQLDAAGPLRTVPQTVVLNRWSGRADGASALGLGRRTGAELVVYGQVLRRGRDSVAIRASVLERASGRTLHDFEVAGAEERMGELADSLGVSILRALGRERPIGSSRGVAIGAKSMPALKAFLRGEQFFRRNLWDSALVHYDEAVSSDPEFALALRRMFQALSWPAATTTRYRSLFEYLARAVALNHGLSPRDSLRLLADSFSLAYAAAGDAGGRTASLYGQLHALEEAARRYPEDPGVWYELGEALYHSPAPLGGPPARALGAFERSIALDPGFGPAYVHAVELALEQRRPADALRLARAGAAIAGGHDGSSLRIADLLLQSGPGSAERELRTASGSVILLAADHLKWATDSGETALAPLRALLDARFDGEVGPGKLVTDPRLRSLALASGLAFRGHLRSAAALAARPGVSQASAGAAAAVDPFIDLALFGAVPDSLARSVFAEALAPGAEWHRQSVNRMQRHLRGAAWWLARGDTAALVRLARMAAGQARGAAEPVAALRGRYLHAVANAYLVLARGDSAAGARMLAAIPDTLCLFASCLQEKLTLARLAAARGDDAEAAALIDRWGSTDGATPSAVLAALERGRIAERLGDTVTARGRYRLVAEAWRGADRELAGYVEEARAAGERLARHTSTR